MKEAQGRGGGRRGRNKKRVSIEIGENSEHPRTKCFLKRSEGDGFIKYY